MQSYISYMSLDSCVMHGDTRTTPFKSHAETTYHKQSLHLLFWTPHQLRLRFMNHHTFQKKFTIKNPQPVPSKVTVSIISPPPKKGGDDLKSSARPHKKPMPVGPHILWPGCESWFWYNKLLYPNIELRVMRSIIVRLMNYQQAEQWIAWGVAFLDLEPFLPLILINTSAKV